MMLFGKDRKCLGNVKDNLLGLDSDGDRLALGKELAAIGLAGKGELANAGGTAAVVGNKRSNTLDGTTILALDLNIGAVRVQLTVSNSVVPVGVKKK
jgi:hypothetical protein